MVSVVFAKPELNRAKSGRLEGLKLPVLSSPNSNLIFATSTEKLFRKEKEKKEILKLEREKVLMYSIVMHNRTVFLVNINYLCGFGSFCQSYKTRFFCYRWMEFNKIQLF